MKRMVAHVCLRSWNLIWGSPARLSLGLKLRYIRLLEFDLEALRRQEESGLVGDAQLSQKRELIPVGPLTHDLAIPNLGKQRPRHPHSSPGRGNGLSRDGSKPFGVGTARRPVDEDVISLGDDVQHL